LCDESTEQSGAKREQKAEDGRIPGHPSMGIDWHKPPIPIDAKTESFGRRASIRVSYRFPPIPIDTILAKPVFGPEKAHFGIFITLGKQGTKTQLHTCVLWLRLGFFTPNSILELDKLQIIIPLED
jgi:hypothetical protein